jgi:hypothetical protein
MSDLPPAASTAPLVASPVPADGWGCAATALVARLAVVAWAIPRFPPSEDGRYYHVVASRIADGQGYTWLWPDGAVTAAAHYPVGYPALLGLAYAVFGRFAAVAMIVNAFLGALAALAVHRVASEGASRRGALLAGLSVALHPGLVFYTPALMTEGAALSLLALAAWAVVRARRHEGSAGIALRAALPVGLALGVATLVRPQLLLVAPAFGVLCLHAGGVKARALLAVFVTLTAVAVCLPWTARNCVRMHSCALVSVNAGWNLYIGAADGATGSWVPLDRLGVPAECRTVWDEAAKDACFGAAGRRAIALRPGFFASLVPAKLATTFDYAGAAGWYLHSANSAAFGERAKTILGVVETIWQRLIVLAALAALFREQGSHGRFRKAITALSALFLFVRPAWVAHVGLVLGAASLGKRLGDRPPAALALTTVGATLLTHAVFFGAGRYSLICFPALSALAGTLLTAQPPRTDTS